MVHCCSWLLKRESIIREVWNAAQFEAGARDQHVAMEDGERQHDHAVRLNVNAISDVIASDFFWRFLGVMIRGLGDLGEDLAKWFSACPCHERFEVSSQASTTKCMRVYMRGIREKEEKREMVCPMAGKRAPEVALGKHLEYMQCQYQHKRTVLEDELQSGVGGMAPADIAAMLSEYDAAFDQYLLLLQLKTDYTQAPKHKHKMKKAKYRSGKRS